MKRSKLDAEAGKALREKFRAVNRALLARFEEQRAGGKHHVELGLRNEQVLIDFLRTHLPPKYGVSRGEVVDSKGGIARQCDVVIYDALHAPLLQDSEVSRVLPAESVYAVIELKSNLNTATLGDAVRAVRSVKSLDRSAIVAQHGGHRLHHGPQANPPIFGAVFALRSTNVPPHLLPEPVALRRGVGPEQWVDCICVLGKALVYHFQHTPGRYVPSAVCEEAQLSYYDSEEDTLLLFYLFLLHQLNAKELFPPDFLQYVDGLGLPGPMVYLDAPPATSSGPAGAPRSSGRRCEETPP